MVSELHRQREPNVAAWASSVDGRTCYLSVLTLGEIRKGIERLRPRDRPRAAAYESWLNELTDEFAERLLPVDRAIADEWGRLNVSADRKGIDSLLAATARVHTLTLVTRNTADFEPLGVALLNPWLPN